MSIATNGQNALIQMCKVNNITKLKNKILKLTNKNNNYHKDTMKVIFVHTCSKNYIRNIKLCKKKGVMLFKTNHLSLFT
jgi:hypothetical protein